MRVAPLACAALALTTVTTFAADPVTEGPQDKLELAQRVSRSLWAVIPDPSGGAAQEPVAGSAVALGPGRLLAACGALGRRTEVLLWRHDQRRTARVAGSDPTGQACILAVPDDTALDPPQGVRDPAGLRPGEAVYAVYNETGEEGVLAEGRLAGERDGVLRANLGLPAEVGSAVLFNADASLIGVGAADPREAGTAWAVPPERAAAPDLAVVPIEPLAASEAPADRDTGSESAATPRVTAAAPRLAAANDRAAWHEGTAPLLLRFAIGRRADGRGHGNDGDARDGARGDARGDAGPDDGNGAGASQPGGSDDHGDHNATGVSAGATDQGDGAGGHGASPQDAGELALWRLQCRQRREQAGRWHVRRQRHGRHLR